VKRLLQDRLGRIIVAGAGRQVTSWVGGIIAVCIIFLFVFLGSVAGYFFNLPYLACGLWLFGLVLGPILGMLVNYRLNKRLAQSIGYDERRDNFNAVTGILGSTVRKCPCGNPTQYDSTRKIWYCSRCGWWSR